RRHSGARSLGSGAGGLGLAAPAAAGGRLPPRAPEAPRMGAVLTCSCAVLSEEWRRSAEEVSDARVGTQAALTDLTDGHADGLSRSKRSFTEPCLASKEFCPDEPGAAASGLHANVLKTAQLTIPFLRSL
ncbi:unnamed protein product, partial [Prorocentrum cordatum]